MPRPANHACHATSCRAWNGQAPPSLNCPTSPDRATPSRALPRPVPPSLACQASPCRATHRPAQPSCRHALPCLPCPCGGDVHAANKQKGNARPFPSRSSATVSPEGTVPRGSAPVASVCGGRGTGRPGRDLRPCANLRRPVRTWGNLLRASRVVARDLACAGAGGYNRVIGSISLSISLFFMYF